MLRTCIQNLITRLLNEVCELNNSFDAFQIQVVLIITNVGTILLCNDCVVQFE